MSATHDHDHTPIQEAVALIIGTVELLSVCAHELGLKGAFWGAVANLDLNTVGFVIVALFAATWAVALAVWRLARIETRWSSAVRTGPSGPMDAA